MISKFFLNQDFVASKGRRSIALKAGTEIEVFAGDNTVWIGALPLGDGQDPDNQDQYSFPLNVINEVFYKKVVHMGDVYLVTLDGLKEWFKATMNHTHHGGLDTIGKKIDHEVMNLNDINDVKAKEIFEHRERFGW